MTAVVLRALPARHGPLFEDLDRWVARGWLRELDRAFAAFLAQAAEDADPLLILAAALASHQLGRGHACLDLAATLADAPGALALPPPDGPRASAEAGAPQPSPPAALLRGIDLARWLRALEHPALVGTGPGDSPLVRVEARLYLRRYWQHEQSVRAAIAARVGSLDTAAGPARLPALRAALDLLFTTRRKGSGPDWQKLACALAARRRFSIVTGGPGTGKTTTVVRLLALLQHLALADGGRQLRIRLAAPTGKAAARLNASIAGAVDALPLERLGDPTRLRAAIPTEVTTVHRLLGSRPDTRRFRHHAQNPLPLDLLVIDEASMLDLEMTAAVCAALPADARLILLGDKDQLASVEAGAVLGDLCGRADAGHYDPDTVRWVEAATGVRLGAEWQDTAGRPLDQAVTKLRESRRFRAGSGIGRLAAAVNAGDPAAVEAAWQAGGDDLERLGAGDEAAFRRLVAGPAKTPGTAVPSGYRGYLEAMHTRRPGFDAEGADYDRWAVAVLAAHGGFQLLCALREGPHGVAGLNRRIADWLRTEGLLEPEQGGWYAGRPVLVTRNDHGLGLMNGDVGVALALPRPGGGDMQWMLRVAFAAADRPGGVHWVLPSRLHAVETVFAMTVHKSQGSEFAHAALVLPERPSPVLTRELVYTGITRARHRFTLVPAGEAGADVLQAAVRRRVERVGGLTQDDRRDSAGPSTASADRP